MKDETIPQSRWNLAEDQPPAGVYPSGHPGVDRAWDGQAWTGPAIPVDDQGTREKDSRWWRHSAFWCTVVGLIVGSASTVVGAHLGLLAVIALGGLIGTGGPALAVVLTIRRRLHIHELRSTAATWWGIASGILAVGIGILLEVVAPGPALAGPIEEFAKLLLPLILLAAGLSGVRNPRIGIWIVAVAAATFGTIEGVEYVSSSSLPRMNATLDEALFTIVPVVTRAAIELLHIFMTTGAAAVIWLSAHHRRRVFTWAGVGAFIVASAIHAFNDAVITPLGGLAGLGPGLLLLLASYFFWCRPRTRVAVPPSGVTTAPKRWLPPVTVTREKL